MDYKNTIFLPQTDFSMKGNLPQKEPEVLASWDALHDQIRRDSAGKEKFVLPVGPPYANGAIHIGHALSEILKDVVVKLQQMTGRDAILTPGWDCHGLPIEWKVEEDYRAKGQTKEDVGLLPFRQTCRAFAEKWIGIQKDEFKRLGIIADWEHPFSTMSFSSEAAIIEQLGHFLLDGTLYKGLKPVLWSVVEKTALADNEVEYKTLQSDSITVAFPVRNEKNLYAVIWTTTPWSLPGNRAIAYDPNEQYSIVAFDDGPHYIVAKKCLSALQALFSQAVCKIVQSEVNLKDMICDHPLKTLGYDHPVPLLPADFVTMDSGTGLVHVAPSHGVEDFALCQTHKIEVPRSVQDDGTYYDHVPYFSGDHVYKVGAKMIEALRAQGHLVAASKIEHSYPHSWRSKAPLIYRATEQWFIDLEKTGIRQKALDAIEKVQWYPAGGKNRIKAMVENRPDWCLSRQRYWGTPMTLFVHKQTGEPLRDPDVHARIVKLIAEQGGDAWYTTPIEDFLGDKSADYEKVTDILDVWFDSACVHYFLLQKRPELSWPADVFLEGSDQHRGWFQTSLLASCGTTGVAPFKAVVTHGFVLDEKGHKMSKSIGNVVAPQKVIDQYGADVLRQWVVLSDFTEDLRIGDTILQRHQEIYRRFRNTLRYLLGALKGYQLAQEEVAYKALPSLEQYMLHLLTDLDQLQKECLKTFDLPRFYHALHQFCNNDLSSFYFDIRKDCLYCDAYDNPKRRATRTTLHIIFNFLVRWLAPMLSFTAEEAFRSFHQCQVISIHRELFCPIDPQWCRSDLQQQWVALKSMRKVITGALETERTKGVIGSSLEAHVNVYIDPSLYTEAPLEQLHDIAITSSMTLYADIPRGFVFEDVKGVGVEVTKAVGTKCARCWKIAPCEEVCMRCAEVVKRDTLEQHSQEP